MRAMHTSRREGPFLSKRRLHSHLESEICAWHHLQRSRPVACESLRQACCKAITDAINVHSVLMILQFVRQVRAHRPSSTPLRQSPHMAKPSWHALDELSVSTYAL